MKELTISKSEQLKQELVQAERDLERAYEDLTKAENKVFETKEKIKDLEIKATTEHLPSHLYYAGCKFKQDHDLKVYTLLDKQGNVIKTWTFNPSLSDLMEITNPELLKGGS